jgi:hypothetical protein
LWKWDETIQDYVIENSFDFLFEDIDRMECPVGWVTKDMSDDGSIITGFYEWGSGARSSAVLINGEVKRLTCLQDPLELPEGEEDIYMDAEGQARVSANGKYFAGYYAASANGIDMQGWVWNPEQESVTFIGENTVLVCVDNNGVAYGSATLMGPAMKYVDGKCKLLSDEYKWDSPYTLSTIFATSDDGGVLGGISMANIYSDTFTNGVGELMDYAEWDVVVGDGHHVKIELCQFMYGVSYEEREYGINLGYTPFTDEELEAATAGNTSGEDSVLNDL